jgi:hypothetical protein
VKGKLSWRGPHAFLGNIVNYAVEKAGTTEIVIDEIPITTIFKTIEIDVNKVMKTIAFVKKHCPKNKYQKTLIGLLNHITLLFASTTDQDTLNDILDSVVNSIDSGIERIKDDVNEFEEYGLDIFKLIRDMIINKRDIDDIPRRIQFLDIYIKIVVKYIREEKKKEFLRYSFSQGRMGRVQIVSFHYCDLDVIKNDDARIWILDASTHPSFYRNIYKKRLYQIGDSSRVKNNFLVIQSSENKYGINRLMKVERESSKSIKYKPTKDFKDIYSITRKIVRKYSDKKILICCRRSRGILQTIHRGLKKTFPDKKIFVHQRSSQKVDDDEVGSSDVSIDYYPLRGINSYRNYDICILFGGAFPNPNETKRLSVISGINKDVIIKTQREDEMNQAWGRIRPKSDSIIFVLCNLDLGFTSTTKTAYMTNSEIHDFIDNGFFINRNMLSEFIQKKSFVHGIVNNDDLEKKGYSNIPFIENYIKEGKVIVKKLVKKILLKCRERVGGINYSSLKRSFQKYEIFHCDKIMEQE